MPRSLSPELDALQLTDRNRPRWRLYVYDIRSTQDDPFPVTMGLVVGGGGLDVRRDFTSELMDIAMRERGSDSVEGTIGATSLDVRIADAGNVFDPVTGSDPGWLRSGNVVRLLEGYDSIPIESWVWTFTGRIMGKAGHDPRSRNGSGVITFSCEDRLADFLKMTTTSAPFVQGTDYNTVMRRILEDNAGLSALEYDIGLVGQGTTEHAVTQFADESPIVSLAKILFPIGFVPRFDGAGVLRVRTLTVDKGDDRVYPSSFTLQAPVRPYRPDPAINQVEVTGQSSDLTRVEQPPQVVATAGITLGFFSGDASIKVKFSDDGTILVNKPKLRVISSVTGALIPFGSESFRVTVRDTDPLDANIEGALEGRIDVEGAFYAPLIVHGFAGRIAASFIPDTVPLTGSTIPVGRIIEGVISVLNSTIMATIGRGEYEIVGTPYEYVFEELRAVAKVKNVPPQEIRPVAIQNALIVTQAQADAVALRELRMARKRSNVVRWTMRHDLLLEPDDRFRTPDDRSYIIASIERRIARGQPNMATLETFEVTPGVHP